MGSYFEVRLAASVPGASELACRALDRIEDLESQMTVYRDDSEISRLNASAHLGPFRVEPRLFSLLQKAEEIGRSTSGVYDIATGSLSTAWGFTKGPKRVPSESELAHALARSGINHVHINADRSEVGFDREGVSLNLGSIGKGYALDEAARVIRDHWWPTSALLHGGRSSVYAVGSPPGPMRGAWQVALRNPFEPSRPLGRISLRNRGLGTSGASFQQFEQDGKLFGHIIDPRTGFAAESGPASVSVLAPTAAEADALSTAFFLMGPSQTRDYLLCRPEIAALFVMEADAHRPPRLIPINIRDGEFEQDPLVRLAVWTR
jgi:thiamine biosynthesis lipoprotein